MTNPLPAYQHAINQIDDYFEYRHESERDKVEVMRILAELTEALVAKPEHAHGCKECGGQMSKGIAIAQTTTGKPDFPGDKECVTMSPGGPGKLVDCVKCVECGWSVSR